ncbi:MAG: hypothetical protein M1834_001220 [Cirrosporium novae-zelandiae]|nr:MAG: hypothetical protein M1834_001220 [Cirrosporium novae-zelandiae]
MAPRTEEAEAWYAAVYEAVQMQSSSANWKSTAKEIPVGHVTSYGHIAQLLGRPECPRQVGNCLKYLPANSPTSDHYFHNENVPWQRVINSKGIISPRCVYLPPQGSHRMLTAIRGPDGATRQAEALRREGVQVERGNLGELKVDLAVYGWFPNHLPGEESEEDEDGERGEGR